MNITHVEILLRDEIGRGNDKLLAFASIVIDGDFVVKDLKVIRRNGSIFVAMPSRKRAQHCATCGEKNPLMAKYCNACAAVLPEDSVAESQPFSESDGGSRVRRFADIAHPITRDARSRLEQTVLDAYFTKLQWNERRA